MDIAAHFPADALANGTRFEMSVLCDLRGTINILAICAFGRIDDYSQTNGASNCRFFWRGDRIKDVIRVNEDWRVRDNGVHRLLHFKEL